MYDMTFSALHTARLISFSSVCVCVCVGYKPATKTAAARATFYGSRAEREHQ